MATAGTIIAEERDVRHGSNGLYDLRLRRRPDGSLLIEVSLSFFFEYIPNGANPSITWSEQERTNFRTEWLRQIPAAWNRDNHTTHNGQSVSVAFFCDVRGAAAGTQWQAHVMKLQSRNAFRTSAVCRGCYDNNYDAKFDSNDDLIKPGGRRQTAMVHEFGHMLGLPDEYTSGSPHEADKNSIMNLGSELRERHLKHLVDWAKAHIGNALADGGASSDKRESAMRALRRIAEAETADQEIEAVKAWRDSRGPGEGVHFLVRRRDTQQEVPLDEVSFEDYASLELEFSSAEEEQGEVFVWQPKAGESLEMFFVE